MVSPSVVEIEAVPLPIVNDGSEAVSLPPDELVLVEELVEELPVSEIVNDVVTEPLDGQPPRQQTRRSSGRIFTPQG